MPCDRMLKESQASGASNLFSVVGLFKISYQKRSQPPKTGAPFFSGGGNESTT